MICSSLFLNLNFNTNTYEKKTPLYVHVAPLYVALNLRTNSPNTNAVVCEINFQFSILLINFKDNLSDTDQIKELHDS